MSPSVRDAPIGVFDSGIGGLTVLRELVRVLPRERFTYLGDTARLPYGTKSAQTVARYGAQAAEALVRTGVKALVVACNTASSVALAPIRARVAPLPVIGVIEPGAASACAVSRSGRIAVIATERTVRGGAYRTAIERRRPTARVEEHATGLFVALAEEGLEQGPVAECIARHYLAPLFGPDAKARAPDAPDTLLLGCTHFPVLLPAIRAVIGAEVSIVDSAVSTARAVREALAEQGLECTDGAGGVRFLATDGPERFARVGSRFLGQAIAAEQVELVDL